MKTPVKLFLAYSHLDVRYRHELERHLHLLSKKRNVSWWGEHEILPGEERVDATAIALARADIIVILVSIYFLADEFCWGRLMSDAIYRHEQREAVVIPVYVRSCPWEDTPIARLQGLPKDGKPVSRWSDRHSAWTEVVRGIQQTIDGWQNPGGAASVT